MFVMITNDMDNRIILITNNKIRLNSNITLLTKHYIQVYYFSFINMYNINIM